MEYLEKQKSIDMKIDARPVRLDIYMSDGETVYNVEMQTTSGEHLPKRSRYYQGQIDMNLIAKGESYKKLKTSFVIFICTFDPFKQDQYVYSFENVCQMENQKDNILLGDDTYKIFINTKGKTGNVTETFIEFMNYFNDSRTAGESTNPLVHSLDAAVREARNNERWRHDYMTWQMYGNEKFDEGIELGRAEGEKVKAKETAKRMFSKGNDVKMIAEMVGETEEEVREWLLVKES